MSDDRCQGLQAGLAQWLYERYAAAEGLWSDIPWDGRSSNTQDRFHDLAGDALSFAQGLEHANERPPAFTDHPQDIADQEAANWDNAQQHAPPTPEE